MEVQVTAMHRCTLVALSGQIDSNTAPILESRLLELIEGGQKNLVLNLAGVSFISSAGLRVFVMAQFKVRRAIPRGELVISSATPYLCETLELVGFHHLFSMYENDVSAVGSF